MNRDVGDYEEMFMKIIKDVVINRDGFSDDEILFTMHDDSVYKMHHDQDCCESVYIEDICGDIEDLKGGLITNFEEVISYNREDTDSSNFLDDSNTWTFYKIDTLKGGITIRWHGSSNGYYSETVSFTQIA